MSDGMEITLTGTDELLRNLSTLNSKMRGPAAVRIVTAGANQIQSHARINIHNVFSKHQTGGLSNSISVEADQQKGGAVAHVIPHKVYARIQELGGTIVPIRGKWLVWRDPDTGKICRARSVKLPPRPYLKPAALDNQDAIVSAMTAQSQKELTV